MQSMPQTCTLLFSGKSATGRSKRGKKSPVLPPMWVHRCSVRQAVFHPPWQQPHLALTRTCTRLLTSLPFLVPTYDWQERCDLLKRRLIEEVEKERAAEIERYETMKIAAEMDTASTRTKRPKLRRRDKAADKAQEEVEAATPTWESSQSGPIVVPYLAHAEVIKDLSLLNKGGSGSSSNGGQSSGGGDGGGGSRKRGSGKAAKVKGDVTTFYDHVNERLYFDGKWFYRGGKVTVEWLDETQRRYSGFITIINLCKVRNLPQSCSLAVLSPFGGLEVQGGTAVVRRFPRPCNSLCLTLQSSSGLTLQIMVRQHTEASKVVIDLAEFVKGKVGLRSSQGKWGSA